jgi:hypothetical protein
MVQIQSNPTGTARRRKVKILVTCWNYWIFGDGTCVLNLWKIKTTCMSTLKLLWNALYSEKNLFVNYLPSVLCGCLVHCIFCEGLCNCYAQNSPKCFYAFVLSVALVSDLPSFTSRLPCNSVITVAFVKYSLSVYVSCICEGFIKCLCQLLLWWVFQVLYMSVYVICFC